MTKIDRTQPLLDQLQEQIAATTTGRKAEHASRGTDEGKPIARAGITPLRDVLAKTLKKADLQSESGRKIARIVFIETVVLDQLGDDLSKDPKFGLLIRKIESALSDDKTLRDRFDGLLSELNRK